MTGKMTTFVVPSARGAEMNPDSNMLFCSSEVWTMRHNQGVIPHRYARGHNWLHNGAEPLRPVLRAVGQH